MGIAESVLGCPGDVIASSVICITEDEQRKMTPDEPPIREPDQIRRGCARKLRDVQVSEHFQAILGCLLDEVWTTPSLVEMNITPDGHLLGRREGESALRWESLLDGSWNRQSWRHARIFGAMVKAVKRPASPMVEVKWNRLRLPLLTPIHVGMNTDDTRRDYRRLSRES